MVNRAPSWFIGGNIVKNMMVLYGESIASKLVGGLEHFVFVHILGRIPTD